MFRNSYRKTAQEKKADSSKHVDNNTHRYAKINPKISRNTRENKRRMHKTEMHPTRGTATIDSNPKDLQKSLETGLKELEKGRGHNETEISPTVLKEMINNSIKEAMQSVVKQCKIESHRSPMYHGNKSGELDSSNKGNKGKRDRSRRKTLQSNATASTNHRSEEKYNKQSKMRSKSANSGRMDNRKMTGNVNIFICSEATDAAQAKKQESSENRPYGDSSLGRIPNSSETMDQTSSTSFGKLEASVSQTERPFLKESLVSNEGEISSNNSNANYTENALASYSRTDKATTQLVAPNRNAVDTALSVDNSAPSIQNAKKFQSNTHRSNDVRLQPKSKVCDKVLRVRGRNYINRELGTVSQGIGHSEKYLCKESRPKCFCREQQKCTLFDSNECRTNRKTIKCPFMIDDKPEQARSPCNCIRREKKSTLSDDYNYHEKSKIFPTCELNKEVSADDKRKGKETLKDPNGTIPMNEQPPIDPQQHKEKLIGKSTSETANNVEMPASSRDNSEEKQGSTNKGQVSSSVGQSFRDVKTSRIISANDNDNTPNKSDQKVNNPLAKNGELKKQENVEKEVGNALKKKEISKNSPPSNLVNETNGPTVKVIKPPRDEKNVIRNASKVKPTPKQPIGDETVIKTDTKQMPQKKSRNDRSSKTTIPSRRAGGKRLEQSTQKIFGIKQSGRSKPSTLQELQNVKENKPLQSEIAHDTKNVQHKQAAEAPDSHEIEKKTFGEKVKASLLCRSVRRLVDKLKRGKSPAKTRNEKTEVLGDTPRATDTGKDNQLNLKENNKPQVRNEINAVRQKRGVRGVVQKLNIPKPDGKKLDATPIGDIPIAPAVTQDKGDGPNYVTPPKAAISQRTENKLNVGQKRKAKLLTAISKKKAFVTMQQHVSPSPIPSPVLHRRDVTEEKKEAESEESKSEHVKLPESSIMIDVEKSMKIIETPPVSETEDSTRMVQQPKNESEEISKSPEQPTVPLKVTKDESVKIRDLSTISKPSQDTASGNSDGHEQSEIMKKKAETDETTQGFGGFENDSRPPELQRHASTTLKTEVKSVCVSQIEKEELQNDSLTDQLTVQQCDFSKIYRSTEHKPLIVRLTTSSTSCNDCNCTQDNKKGVKDIRDVCQISYCNKNAHFSKTMLKKSKENLLAIDEEESYSQTRCHYNKNPEHLSKSKYSPDKKFTISRPHCVRCCKWEESDNYDTTLHHIDTHIKMERHRCKKTLVCLYCDKPRDKCICRIPVQHRSRCKASKDLNARTQDQRASYRPNRSFPIYSPIESHRPFTRDLLPKYHDYFDEDCHCHERTEYETLEDVADLSHKRSATFSNVMSEIQRKASDITGCSVVPRNQEKNVSSEIHRLNNNDAVLCKSDCYAPALDQWKGTRATDETKRKKPSAKCYYCKNWPCFCITLREESKPRPCRCADSRSCRKEKVSRCPRNNEELVCVR